VEKLRRFYAPFQEEARTLGEQQKAYNRDRASILVTIKNRIGRTKRFLHPIRAKRLPAAHASYQDFDHRRTG